MVSLHHFAHSNEPLARWLRSIAEVTVLDVLTDETQHLWLPVVAHNELQCLEATRMTSDLVSWCCATMRRHNSRSFGIELRQVSLHLLIDFIHLQERQDEGAPFQP